MATIDNIVADLRKAIESAKSGKTQAYDTVATVKRVAGNTAWVQIPGGTSETPVQLTIACQPGDTVQVRVGGGRAWLTGNQSAPPTDDREAKVARSEASRAQVTASKAHEVAEEASTVAGEASANALNANQIASNTNQYFWHTESGDDTGAHITEKTQEEFLADPQNGGGNTILRSNGMAVRDGLTELATFGADEARIGQSSAAHSVIDSNGHRFYASDGTTQLANIGYGAGSSAAGVVTNAPYYTFGTRKSPTNDYSASSTYNMGDMCWYTTNGVRRPYICETPITTPEVWTREHWLLAIGNESFAEGRRVVAAHLATHAEGIDTIALGGYSHAEGASSKAYGYASHAEGQSCISSGRYSHAQNDSTIASKDAQTVIGRFNLEDTSDTDAGEYAFIIGNGTATATYYRSNALTVDWDGNVEAAGSITDGYGGSMPHFKDITNEAVVATTTGQLNGYKMAQYGHVRMLRIAVQKSSATAAGSNLYTGKIDTVPDRPLFSSAYGCGYVGSACVVASIAESGDIVVRVTGGSVAANTSTWLGITYIAQGEYIAQED